MALEPGKMMLHYRLVDKVGEGGMGVVWKALDTTLDREVAIKLLPETLAAETDRLARFEREAKLLASLNHPNIAAIYGLHECDGERFIAMELIPGEDLADVIARGPIPVERSMEIAQQVADALEVAHEQGVIHRDLKPANIRLGPDGRVKVLDFGLAKAFEPDPTGSNVTPTMSPTLTSAGTVAGMVLGTAAYMAPEQARGHATDKRADIWAFGAVVYEMLTGKMAFPGETISDTLASVLKLEPDWEALPDDAPPLARRLLERCLEKDARKRLRDIGEARIRIDRSISGEVVDFLPEATASTTEAGPARSSRLPWVPWVLVAALSVFGVWAMIRGTGDAPDVETLKLAAWLPTELSVPVDQMGVMALSPDGRTLALTLIAEGQQLLHVRRLDTGELSVVPGTSDARTPFFSPDGQWIGFFANGQLKKVRVDGGQPVTICDAQGSNRGASWTSDDWIVFAPHYVQPLMRVRASGGTVEPLTEIDTEKGERTHRWPQSVSEHDLVLFTVGTIDSPENYDDARIMALRPSSGERKIVLERASMARYLPTGHLLYGRAGLLFAVPFDVETLETTGTPVPVVEEVMGMSASGVVHFAVSSQGLLAYLPGTTVVRENRLIFQDRDGTVTPLAAPMQGYLNPRVSPDGRRITVQYPKGSNFDIGIFDLERATFTRMTFEGDNMNPTWSRDGRWLAFGTLRNNQMANVWVKSADGSGSAREICASLDFGSDTGGAIPSDWSLDDEVVIVQYGSPLGQNLGYCSVETGEAVVVLETPAGEFHADLSPDGRWLAYASDESGGSEVNQQVFVQAFPEGGGKWQISTEGGTLPRWSPDGSRLFYRVRDKLYEVLVDDAAGTLGAGRPQLVLDGLRSVSSLYFYDVVSNDRFLFVEDQAGQDTNRGVTVVVNWFEELKRLVP